MAPLPDGFDLDALLAPLPGESPQGTDLREDYSAGSPYFRLRDARSEARDAEKAAERGESDAADPTPMWRSVRDLGVTCLTGAAKDLEVAAWLTEALLRLNGLSGLTAGALLMKGLAEQYWDVLYPLPDEYGVETRVAPVTGLNGRDGAGSLIQPLYKIPLFTRRDGTIVTLYHWHQSEELGGRDAARRQQRIAAGAIPFDELETEARGFGPRLFGPLREVAASAHDAWQGMADLLDGKAGRDGPSTTQVRDLLARIVGIATRFAPPEAAPAEAEAVGEVAPDGSTATVAVAGMPVRGAGPIATREDALKALSDIAAWFRRSEPHSPLSYTLDEAVRRGRLTWPELLEEVVQEETSRHAILTSLGIRPPHPPSE
jgi:type VI secretion system protein ImpA